ncbi:MAG: cation:proton antiporter [Thermoplasmata archaeon]|nr:cation:proton antiporter [Thermoplasmata archaeon]
MDISILVYVLLIIAVAKAMGELVTRVNQPPVVGELLAGIILGPFVLGAIINELNTMYTDEFIQGLADLGILLLMLHIGLEFSPKRLIASSKIGVPIAIAGIVVPMVFVYAGNYLFGLSGSVLLFVALAVAVTALPVTIKILKDMEVLHTETSSRIVSAAVITDIALLLAIGIVLGTHSETAQTNEVAYLAIGYIIFFILAFLVSRYIVPQLYRVLRWMRTGEAAFAIAIGVAIGFAVFARFVGLPDFMGAFIAGMILRETGTGLKVWTRVEDILSGITIGFLAPIFFVLMGFTVDFGAVFGSDISVIFLFCFIFFVAISGKIIGTLIPARIAKLGKNESLAIGFMMIGKGEMALVISQVGFDNGTIDPTMFSILVLTAFILTALSPIMFKRYFNRAVLAHEIVPTKEEIDETLRDNEIAS